MKVIDLLNKIANGEEAPKHIHIRDVDSYTWQEDVKEYWSDRDENNLLSDLDLSSTNLNEEVEIIEEPKKIEKIEMCTGGIMSFDSVENITTELKDKINELIDEINNLKENK